MLDWQQLERRHIYDSPHMKMWEDTVKLPSGAIIDDFSGADLPDGVLVVATDTDGNMMLFEEYKYAVKDTVLTFPAGGIEEGESPLEAAAKELREETGYESSELEVLARLYPYPSKINHASYIVRARNARKVAETTHSEIETETIGRLQLIPPSQLRELRTSGKINTTYVMSALALAFPKHF